MQSGDFPLLGLQEGKANQIVTGNQRSCGESHGKVASTGNRSSYESEEKAWQPHLSLFGDGVLHTPVAKQTLQACVSTVCFSEQTLDEER